MLNYNPEIMSLATQEVKTKANEKTIIFSHTPSGSQVENPT